MRTATILLALIATSYFGDNPDFFRVYVDESASAYQVEILDAAVTWCDPAGVNATVTNRKQGASIHVYVDEAVLEEARKDPKLGPKTIAIAQQAYPDVAPTGSWPAEIYLSTRVKGSSKREVLTLMLHEIGHAMGVHKHPSVASVVNDPNYLTRLTEFDRMRAEKVLGRRKSELTAKAKFVVASHETSQR